jgi:hypothetical protein
MRCGADVALDTFRKPVGKEWLCSECIAEDDAAQWHRRKLFTRAAAALAVVAVAGGLTAGALQLGPVLFAPHSTRTK